MPSSSIKNDKQYEALGRQGDVQAARRPHRQLAGCVHARRAEVGVGRRPFAGRHDRSEEESGSQGRKGNRSEEALDTDPG